MVDILQYQWYMRTMISQMLNPQKLMASIPSLLCLVIIMDLEGIIQRMVMLPQYFQKRRVGNSNSLDFKDVVSRLASSIRSYTDLYTMWFEMNVKFSFSLILLGKHMVVTISIQIFGIILFLGVIVQFLTEITFFMTYENKQLNRDAHAQWSQKTSICTIGWIGNGWE